MKSKILLLVAPLMWFVLLVHAFVYAITGYTIPLHDPAAFWILWMGAATVFSFPWIGRLS